MNGCSCMRVVKKSAVNNKLLKIFAFAFLVASISNVESMADVDANKGSSIIVDAPDGVITINGEIKDVIKVRFPGATLQLFQDNGDEVAEKDRTYTFEVIRLTKAGAKLRLSPGDGNISYKDGTWWISRKNGEREDEFELSFMLYTPPGKPSEENRRVWGADDAGYYYTFKEEDETGKWYIVVKLKTSIKKQKSGTFTAKLKISIDAD